MGVRGRSANASHWLAAGAVRSPGPPMPAVFVPDLKQKFRLLRTYTARTRWPALAEPFGTSHKTLQYWVNGLGSREPGQIPEWAVPILTGLIAGMLPSGRSDDEIRRLVFGPAARLEEEIRSGAGALLSAIIAAEGRQDGAILIRRPADDAQGLVEVEEDRDSTLPSIASGAPFRIEFPILHTAPYAVALQNAQQAWAVLPMALREAAPRRLLVPGNGAGDVPSWMRERRDHGLHRFVCLQSPAPFPAGLDEHRREGTALDKRGLEELARFYQALPARSRACHVLSLIVESAPSR